MRRGLLYAAYLAAMITVFTTISGYVQAIYEPVVDAVSTVTAGGTWQDDGSAGRTIRSFSDYIEENFHS